MPALSVTYSATAAAVCGLWRCGIAMAVPIAVSSVCPVFFLVCQPLFHPQHWPFSLTNPDSLGVGRTVKLRCNVDL